MTAPERRDGAPGAQGELGLPDAPERRPEASPPPFEGRLAVHVSNYIYSELCAAVEREGLAQGWCPVHADRPGMEMVQVCGESREIVCNLRDDVVHERSVYHANQVGMRCAAELLHAQGMEELARWCLARAVGMDPDKLVCDRARADEYRRMHARGEVLSGHAA